MSRILKILATLALAHAVQATVCAPVHAQQVDSTRGGAMPDTSALLRLMQGGLTGGITQAELVERLRQSGLTRSQARDRLRQMGRDPALADPYFDVIERGGDPPTGEVDPDLLQALRSAGVDVQGLGRDSLFMGLPDSLWFREMAGDTSGSGSELIGGLEVFGRSLFRRWTTQFAPDLIGPVDPDYRLGPGDELVLVLTGDVEAFYRLPVSREGYVVIPDVGQVFVNGVTLGDLEDRFYDRLGRVYSGVRRSAEATTRFQVSLGKLRVNQVYLIGDVDRPGAYPVSAMATVLHALYRAGGPSLTGSFRRIEVKRGGRTVSAVDLYDYLLRGDSRSDVRLEHGDVIFVPPYGARVRVEGAVRRPAIYEVLETDGLREVLAYAGGLDAGAAAQRVQIDRILPPERRRPGVERVLVDVDLAALRTGADSAIALRDGDAVQAFAVSEERRNRVEISGEVRQPGSYEWSEGLTLLAVIDRAGGLRERAYTVRGHIYRLNENDGSRRLLQAPVLVDSASRSLQDLVLADRDSIVIFDRAELRNPEFVTIHGFVKNPGTFELAEGMTVPDLVLAAGGFLEGADPAEAEVARLPDDLERTDRTATILRLPLAVTDGALKAAPPGDAAAAGGAREPIPDWLPEAEAFRLRHGDRIFIRKAPGYALSRTVTITGQVLVPGTYVLETRQERLANLIRRAGGLTDEAYVPGLQLVRDSSLVATDLLRALEDPPGRYNLVLQAGDSLHVPEYDPTVLVTGAVTFESRVLFEPGRGLDYYINRAGGYVDVADRDRVTVMYQDGERASVVRRLKFFTSKPELHPGSTIYVPAKPEGERGGFNWTEFITRTSAMATALVTILLAVDRL